MSSLFNYGTVFEPNEHDSKYNASFPLEVFVYKDLADYQDILDPVKILLSLQGKSIEDSEVLDDEDDEDDYIIGLSEDIDGGTDEQEDRDPEELPYHEESLEELGREEIGQVDSEELPYHEESLEELGREEIGQVDSEDAEMTDTRQQGKRGHHDGQEAENSAPPLGRSPPRTFKRTKSSPFGGKKIKRKQKRKK